MKSQQIFANNIECLRRYSYKKIENYLPYSDILATDIIYNKHSRKYSILVNGEVFAQYMSNSIDDIYKQQFSNLPILLKNEYDFNLIEFLVHNVRSSECYQSDNRVYLYYDSLKGFMSFLAVYDFSNLLMKNNLVFLIGEKALTCGYPLVCGKPESAMPKKLKAKEIVKLVFAWPWAGYSGNFFFDTIMDNHPNLLTIKEFGLAAFGVIYREILAGKTVKDGIDFLQNPGNNVQKSIIETEFNVLFTNAMFLTETPRVPTKARFFQELIEVFETDNYLPTKKEWFQGLFLAYSYALDREFKGRILPGIFLNMHSIQWPVTDCKREMLDVYDQFEDLKVVSLLRSQLGELGSVMQAEKHNNGNREYDYLSYVEIAIKRSALYVAAKDKWLNKRGVLRFEDLKLFPQETTEALCEFLQIPWEPSLLQTTANGSANGYVYGGTKTKGWDIAPVYNLHLQSVGILDFYRLEVLKGNYYKPWGYDAKFYDGVKFSKEDLLKLYELPFKCENFVDSVAQRMLNKETHQRLAEVVLDIQKKPIPLDEEGNEKIPVFWIKPNIPDDKLYH